MVMFKVSDRLIIEKISRLMREECGPCPSLHVTPWHMATTEGKNMVTPQSR